MKKTMRPELAPWYGGRHREMVIYLLAAIFFLEMLVGGVAFFYGVIHAAPETPGGPPTARFPFLGWAVAAVLSPVFLLLLVRIIGGWISGSLDRADASFGAGQDPGQEIIPEKVRNLYAIARNAPAIVVLAGILILGAALILADGAVDALKELVRELLPHLPLLGGMGLGFCGLLYLIHRYFAYRQKRMEAEYAYRREVLERTGIVLVDRRTMRLPESHGSALHAGPADLPPAPAPGLSGPAALPAILDVTPGADDAGRSQARDG